MRRKKNISTGIENNNDDSEINELLNVLEFSLGDLFFRLKHIPHKQCDVLIYVKRKLFLIF